jgi:hypothetical protein
VVGAACYLIATAVVEADGGKVFGIDVKPDLDRAFSVGRAFNAAEKFSADSEFAIRGRYLDGGDVGDDAGGLHGPLDDRETGDGVILFGYPGGGFRRCKQVAHVASGETLGRLKADLFDGIEIVKVFGLEEAVVHGVGGVGGVRRRRAAVSGVRGFCAGEGNVFPTLDAMILGQGWGRLIGLH